MQKALYAQIAANRCWFVVQLDPEGFADKNTSSASREHCTDVIFKDWIGTDLPLVDFSTMTDWNGYSYPTVFEAHRHRTKFGDYVKLADWLEDLKKRGAVVTTLKHYTLSAEGKRVTMKTPMP